MRQPCEPRRAATPRRRRRSRAAQLVAPPVELRQRGHAEPRGVAVRQRLVEVVEAALRRVGIRLSSLEPLVPAARVVQASGRRASLIPRASAARAQRRERLVAAEQRIDAIERARVVAMGRARREDRRQVDGVRTERLDVVEMLLDPGQVAAVPLAAESPARGRSVARPTRAGRPSRAACARRPTTRTGRGRSRRRPTPRCQSGPAPERHHEVVARREPRGSRAPLPVSQP